MTSILKGAIYCRVSTDEQEANGTSLQSQKLECLKFAGENNLKILDEYIFLEQYSGAYFDRPQLVHLFSVASKGLIDFVVFMKRDRVARDIFVFHQIMKELEKYKVKVFYAKELNSGDSAMDNFMGNTIINFASFEREQIKNRTILGKKTFAINNKRPFGNIPYGYNKNNKTKELEIFEDEKNIVSRIVKNYLEDKLPIGTIAKNLTKDNILPPSFSLKKENEKLIEKEGKKNSIYFWSMSNVQRILSRSEMYAGIYQAFSKEYKKVGDKTILLGDRPKEEWIQIKVPPIITLKESKLIKEQLEKNRRYSKKRSVRNYMLQGILFCDCEKSLFHNFIGYFNNTKELRNYRCSMHNSTRVSQERLCSNHISGLKIEGVVFDTLKELFLNHEYIFEKALDELDIGKIRDENNRYLDLYGLILEIEEKHKRNEELYIEGMIAKDRFIEIKSLLEKKKIEYSDEMIIENEKIKSSIFREQAKRNLKDIIEEIKDYIETFFDNASYDELKELANIVIDKVIVPKNKENPVRIILKIPLNVNDFHEKYYEEELIEYIDDNDKVHTLGKTGKFIPKLLNLSPTKKPLKYRTVEFKNDNNLDNSDLEKNERKFLLFLKEKYNQICKSDHNEKQPFLIKWKGAFSL